MNNGSYSPATPTRLELRALLDLLIADGLLTAVQARETEVRNQQPARHPLLTIAEREWDHPQQPGRKLGVEALTQWLAKRTDLAYLRIDPLNIDVSRITSVVSYAYAARARILPVKLTPTEITVAVADPYARDWEADLSRLVKQKIVRVLANPQDIDRYLIEFYALARSVKSAENERARLPTANMQNLEQLTELGRSGKLDANDQHVVSIVDWLLQYAFDQRASDIHLEPRREAAQVRFRIDGLLHEVYQMPIGVYAAVSSRLKILARMDVSEKRKPQDGRIKTRSPAGKEIELRVASLPTAFGEKMVLRIFDPEVLVKDFIDLGFAKRDLEAWQSMIEQPNGIVLVTGPTGSGKTTTLYSTLRQLSTPKVNVCTIEDPIELVEPRFNQMQVHPAIDLTFASGVRALMRQDPDIIMVGEIRDLETAEVAIQAALTGHLVLSTLHTNDAPSAVTRLLDLGVPAYLLKSTLLGVVAQRLVRTLCPHCKRAQPVDPKDWADLVDGWKLEAPAQIYTAAGCLECRETGYLGRAGIYEIMALSAPLKTLLQEEGDPLKLRELALRNGMLPLRISGALKVGAGLTTIAEVMRVAPPPLRSS
ncbi:MAG TPA: GspE/PulE family protein [Solimonas sp.]